MGLALKKSETKYTYGDYCYWPDNERWELIHGKAYCMSPAPSRSHQDISRELLLQIGNYLSDKPCTVYDAPFDVRLPEADESDEDIETVVQPDIIVVCDEAKLDKKGCRGAPDLIIEITSPSTSKKDLKEKFFLYEKHGVKEYWIANPLEKFVMVYKLESNKKYGKPEIYVSDEKIKVGIIKGLIIDLNFVFKKEKYDKKWKQPPLSKTNK
ncbi:MAG: Uma2 family endonuclease [Spirochaetes bacterium]|nr:Uma2 family endonuclease [Spirochaetota bacterium]